jgi:hypothetical protein
MSTLEVNTINPQSGTTITIGGSGDTVSLGSGATQSGFGGVNTPAFRARATSNQTVNDNVITKANFGTEIYDTDNAYDTSNSRFTVPTGKGGKYVISVTSSMQEFGSLNHGGSLIFVNGTGVQHQFVNWSSSYGDELSTTCSATLELSAGDYVEGYVQFNTGDGSNTIVQALDANNYILTVFEGFKLVE